MKIIDNFISENEFLIIKNLMHSENFPWYIGNILTKESVGSEEILNNYNHQFFHIFFSHTKGKNSSHINTIMPIIKKINTSSVVRIKSNLLTRTEKIIEHGYHSDFPNITTAVFYMNTNNGYTKFKSGEIVESVENRIVFFDSNMLHTGSTCTDQNFRTVLNINFVGGFENIKL